MAISFYSEYSDAKLVWLGKLPSHWQMKRLKFVAHPQPSNVDKKTVEDEIPVRLCNYVDVYKNDFIDSKISFMEATATYLEIEKFKLNIGDVIVTKDSETPQDIAIPALVVEESENLICGYHLTQIKPKYINGRFLFRLFQSKGFNAQFIVQANGVTRFGLPSYAIDNAFVPIPTADEQQKIADFLDYKTAHIDALITKKETLLLKLQEKRSALITQAVTKGINPNVPMKPSGVEWLGDVPNQWTKTKLKFVSEIILGLTYSPADLVSEGEGALVLRSSNVQNGLIELKDNVYVNSEIPERLRTKIDDILICSRNGSRALIGKCALIDSKSQGQTFGAFMTLLRSKHAKFIYYILNSNIFKFQSSRFLTSTINQLTTETLGGFEIALPPIDEQNSILEYLEEKTNYIDLQIAKIKDVISKLTEYRSALITNAVTGKIDVRDFDLNKTIS